jgi:hypothetical protein
MRLLPVTVALCLATAAANATTVFINSGDGTGWNDVSAVVAGTPLIDPNPADHYADVNIVPHSAWQPNGAGQWISVVDGTGSDNPSVIINSVGSLPNADLSQIPPTATFYQPFTLPNDNNVGSITVWADDTARVSLIGGQTTSLLWDANGNQDAHCAGPEPIGCIPPEGATISLSGLAKGDYTLQFDVYQRGGGPFGLLYQGSVESTATPEPMTFGLMGGALIGVLGLARRFKR